ncbi:MAG TPA: TetR family transcriptional regulator C-terminal domain-containing protein [Microbacterium sp.]|nr:TetR family transcriptional regulator C-terminal domain-containing protein [Microbacterium sp.]
MSSTSTKVRTRKTPAERSAEILAAATLLAREQGLSALTLRAVAERAGVASGLIAHYQPSMDDLLARVYSDLVGAEIREVEALLAARSGPAQRMAALIGTLLDGTRDDLTVVWVEAWALGRRNPALAVAVRDQMDAWHRLVATVVDEGCTIDAFTTPSSSDAAWQVLGMIDGLNAQSLARGIEGEGYVEKMARAAEILLGAPSGTIEAR